MTYFTLEMANEIVFALEGAGLLSVFTSVSLIVVLAATAYFVGGEITV